MHTKFFCWTAIILFRFIHSNPFLTELFFYSFLWQVHVHVAVDTPTIPLYHLHHSLNIKLQTMKLTLASLHLVNENVYNGNIGRILAANWDFKHIDLIIEKLLQDKPNHDLYLYSTVESAYDHRRPSANFDDQAPIIVIIAIPSGCVPTRLMGYRNNQTGEECVHPFERYQFHWAQAQDPSYHDRVYYLACGDDFSSVPDQNSAAYKVHEFLSPFIPTPRDMNLEVGYVQFHFEDLNGDEHSSSWYPQEEPLNVLLDRLMATFFRDDSDDEDDSDGSDDSDDEDGSDGGSQPTEEELAEARENIRQVRSILSEQYFGLALQITT